MQEFAPTINEFRKNYPNMWNIGPKHYVFDQNLVLRSDLGQKWKDFCYNIHKEWISNP